jgi:hypothetical protein
MVAPVSLSNSEQSSAPATTMPTSGNRNTDSCSEFIGNTTVKASEEDECHVQDQQGPTLYPGTYFNKFPANSGSISTTETERNQGRFFDLVVYNELEETKSELKLVKAQLKKIGCGPVVIAKDLAQVIIIKKYVKEHIFKKVKFFNNGEKLNEVMKVLAIHFHIPPNDEWNWIKTYEEDVRDALNQKRNNVTQYLRATFSGMYKFYPIGPKTSALLSLQYPVPTHVLFPTNKRT